jgi:hypothetical protein
MSMQQEDTMSDSTYVAIFGHEFEYAFNMQLRHNYRLDPAPRATGGVSPGVRVRAGGI